MVYTSRRERNRIAPKTVVPSKRDFEIFKLLSRYRYLRGNYIHALLYGNKPDFQLRLAELFRAHYVNRPEQQWQFFNSNYRHAIYELDEKAIKLIGQNRLEPIALFKHLFNEFAHNLMLCDVMANIEIGAKAKGAIIKPYPEQGLHVSIRDVIKGVLHTSTKPLIPDAVFDLIYPDGKVLHFALEVDCGTEPVERSNLEQSSYKKKVLQYKEAIKNGAFPHSPTWVLHVTNSEHRKEHIKSIFGPSKSNLFKVHPVLGDFCPDPKPDGSFFGSWERVGNPDFEM